MTSWILSARSRISRVKSNQKKVEKPIFMFYLNQILIWKIFSKIIRLILSKRIILWWQWFPKILSLQNLLNHKLNRINHLQIYSIFKNLAAEMEIRFPNSKYLLLDNKILKWAHCKICKRFLTIHQIWNKCWVHVMTTKLGWRTFRTDKLLLRFKIIFKRWKTGWLKVF